MSIVNLFVAARNAIAARRSRQRAYTELAALDDRSLADIGIHRSQIPANRRPGAMRRGRATPEPQPGGCRTRQLYRRPRSRALRISVDHSPIAIRWTSHNRRVR